MTIDGVNIYTVIGKRMRLWGAERVRDAYEKVVRAETAIIRASQERNEALVSYAKSEVPLHHLDAILEEERSQIFHEINSAKAERAEQLAEAERQAEFRQAVHDLELLKKQLTFDRLAEPAKDREKGKSPLEEQLDKFRERADALKTVPEFLKHLCENEGVQTEDELTEGSKTLLRKFRETIEMGMD